MDEEENNEIKDAVQNNVSDDEPADATESDDDFTLSFIAGSSDQASSNDQDKQIMSQSNVYILGEKRYDTL